MNHLDRIHMREKVATLTKWSTRIFELVKIIIIIAMIGYLIHIFIMTLYVVDGTSMEPNLINKEYLLVNKVSYYFREPRRGEVVVFTYPGELEKKFIKRIIGLPGESLELNNGDIYIYNNENPKGFRLNEPYLSKNFKTYSEISKTKKIGPNEYFVLGDNRNVSSDSRIWGILPKNYIIGYAEISIWPTNFFGLIKNPQY